MVYRNYSLKTYSVSLLRIILFIALIATTVTWQVQKPAAAVPPPINPTGPFLPGQTYDFYMLDSVEFVSNTDKCDPGLVAPISIPTQFIAEYLDINGNRLSAVVSTLQYVDEDKYDTTMGNILDFVYNHYVVTIPLDAHGYFINMIGTGIFDLSFNQCRSEAISIISNTYRDIPVADITKTLVTGSPYMSETPITWELSVSNSSSSIYSSPNATVFDLLPLGVTYVSSDNGGTYDPTTRTVTWILPPVNPGASSSVHVTVIPDANTAGTIQNVGVMCNFDSNCPQPPPCTEQMCAPPICDDRSSPFFECVVSPVDPKKIVVEKKALQTSSNFGDSVKYELLVTNTGTDPVTGLVVADNLSGVLDDATYNNDASDSGAGGSFAFDPSTGLLTYTGGTLSAGSSITLTYSVTVNDAVTGDQKLLNSAVSCDSTPCAPPTPPTDCENSNTKTCTPIGDLVVQKSVCLATSQQECTESNDTNWSDIAVLPFGSNIYWKLQVTNTGPIPMTDVLVSDPLAPNCSTVLPLLESGETKIITCSSEQVLQGFVNTFCSTSVTTGIESCDTAEVKISNIYFEKTALQTEVSPGGTVEFSFVVTNNGESPLTNVVVTDNEYPICSQTIGDLGIGETSHFTCTVTVGNNDIVNTASVTGQPPAGTGVSVHSTATGNASAQVKVLESTLGRLPTTGKTTGYSFAFAGFLLFIGFMLSKRSKHTAH